MASMRGWSFFEVPTASRIYQSAGIYAQKIRRGWRLILKNRRALIRRFLPKSIAGGNHPYF